MSTVKSIMTAKVVSIDREKLVCELEGLFVSHKISAAPLLDGDGDIAGFVTKSDINRFHFNHGDPYYTRAWEIANPLVITIDVSATIEEAANLMIEKHLHHLLVVDSHGIAGLLSSFDFIKLVANKSGKPDRTEQTGQSS